MMYQEEHINREKAILATKAGLVWNDKGQVWRDGSASSVRKEIEDSLRRLNTDYIDLYQLHWPDSKILIQESASIFSQLHKEGKIRAVGVSNFSPEQVEEWRMYALLHSSITLQV